MYEDDPQDKVFDVLGEAVFGDHPLGPRDHRPRRGRRPARRPTRCARSTPAATCPHNVVVAAAGSVDHDALVELVARRRRSSAPAARAPRAAGAARRPARRAGASSPRRPSSTTCASARPGIARDDERRFALRVLDNDPRRHVVVAAVPGGAREARPGLQRLLVHRRSTPARARSASTSARGPTTSARRCSVVGDELERFCADPASRPRSSSAPRRTSRAASCSRWSRRRRG